jgi:hypothetical protein
VAAARFVGFDLIAQVKGVFAGHSLLGVGVASRITAS